MLGEKKIEWKSPLKEAAPLKVVLELYFWA